MRRAIVASTATVSGIVLLLGLKSHAGDTVGGSSAIGLSIGPSTTGPTSTASPDSTSSAQSPSSSSSGSTAGSTGSSGGSTGSAGGSTSSSATKTVTGDAIDTRYGPIQLQVTVTGTKITNIQVLEYPSESSRDEEINSYALPELNQEAMSAQSAQIDAVSGATYTSEGYIQSLQSALDKAGA